MGVVAGKGWEVGEQPLVRLPVVGMVVEAAELRVRVSGLQWPPVLEQVGGGPAVVVVSLAPT